MIVGREKSKMLTLVAILAGVAMLAILACSSGTTGSGSTDGSTGTGRSANTDTSTGTGNLGSTDGSNNTIQPEFVVVQAPIESVEIVKVAAKPPNASLVIVSGGLNSCESFNDYTMSREGEVFQVQITNLRTAAANVPCTANYGMQEHIIPLPSNEIAGCETYRVEVNGEMFSVKASCPALSTGPSLATGPSVGEKVEALAPIVSAKVLALESFPVQYRLQIESGLPNGCVEFGGYEVARDGETINVRVKNLVPADKSAICTEEYRTVKTTVSLGTGHDYEPATAYTVNVNDASTGFVTDAAPPVSDAEGPKLGEAFDLKVGSSAAIRQDGPTVELMEIVEDSRCPSDVTCVWAGRAVVWVIVSSPDDVLGLGTMELTLEAGAKRGEENNVISYSETFVVTALKLAPYPISTEDLTSQDYTATLVVETAP